MDLDDIIELQTLSDANKERVRLLSDVFEQLDMLPLRCNRMEAYRAAAAELSAKLPAMTRKDKNISVSTLMRLFGDWKKRGWRALVVNYARKSDYVALPGAFIHFWQQLYVQFQVDMSGKQAHDALMDRLNAWRCGDTESAIPGYAEPPANRAGKEHPEGWSLPNLRRHKPATLVTKLIKHGRSAAKSECGPLVRRTRRDLEPGALIVFDDVWQDHDVMYPGQRQVVRPLGLVALDVASGKQIAWGLRPRIREDGSDKSTGLKAFDMEMLITDVLCRLGVHPEGTVFAMERGTANVSAKTEEFLKKFGITVERGGVDRLAPFFGGLPGSFKGNSRFKAALESHHNLMHNIMSCLPGYVGKNRTPPEHAQGMKLAHAALMRRAEKDGLPEHIRNRLGVGHLDWMTFFEAYGEFVKRVNARTEHNLEGWERHMLTEVRFAEGAPWTRFDASLFPPEMATMLTANPMTHRVRRMSPDEVWAAGAGKLKRIQFSAFGELFCQPGSKTGEILDARMVQRVSQRHEFEIRPTLDDPHEYIFSSEIRLPGKGRRILEAGEQYKVLLNPFSGGEELCVFDLDGSYIGSSYSRRVRVPYNDNEAMLPALGQAAKEFAALAHPANTLPRARQAETIDSAAKNKLLLATFAEDQKQKRLAREADKARALERDDLAITQTLDALPAPALPDTPQSDDDFSETSF